MSYELWVNVPVAIFFPTEDYSFHLKYLLVYRLDPPSCGCVAPACTALIPSSTGPGQFSGLRHISVDYKRNHITHKRNLVIEHMYRVSGLVRNSRNKVLKAGLH